MSVTITRRRLDAKRRITIPSESLKDGANVMMVASSDAVIITSDEEIAKQLSSSLRKAETAHKLKTLKEWNDLLQRAGLSDLKSEEIDSKIGKALKRPKRLSGK